MIARSGNRRFLPIVALVASAVVFIGALIFFFNSPTPSVAPTAAANAAPTPTAIAISIPTTVPTVVAAPSAVPAAAATMPAASPTISPVGTARAVSATPSAAPTSPTVAPTVIAGGVVTTPTATLPPPPASAPPASQPPVAPPTATRTPTAAPVVQPPVAPTATPRPPAPPTPTPTRVVAPPAGGPPPSTVGVPVRVRIPSIGVDAAIEQVGVDAEGNMATPEDPWNTAWYAPGARPGQQGNAAIAGHVDYAGLGQVVFWDLNQLGPGDEVLVDTADGATLRFVVQDSVYYRPATAPLQRIFGQTNEVNLNLITCGGAFDPVTRQYDQRLVVFTSYAGR